MLRGVELPNDFAKLAVPNFSICIKCKNVVSSHVLPTKHLRSKYPTQVGQSW